MDTTTTGATAMTTRATATTTTATTLTQGLAIIGGGVISKGKVMMVVRIPQKNTKVTLMYLAILKLS